tara:strand:+ start:358 stop:804 length:447 start_codon:yes stop_codon:yes gene_type:complete
MDKHTQFDNNNPINQFPTAQEEKEQRLNELIGETLYELCEEYLEDNPLDYLSEDTQENLHELTDYQIAEELEDNGFFDVEIIYYANAIDYLREHDNSLRESLEIASEYGYKTEEINSELLASLLASRKKREDFYSYVLPKIQDIINNN